jgi:hypothetical protein
LFFKLLLPLAYRDLRVPQHRWRRAGDMVARLKAGSPRCGSGKIGIENWKDLEEAVLMLKKLGAEATDYVEVVLILEALLSISSIPAALIVP